MVLRLSLSYKSPICRGHSKQQDSNKKTITLLLMKIDNVNNCSEWMYKILSG